MLQNYENKVGQKLQLLTLYALSAVKDSFRLCELSSYFKNVLLGKLISISY